MEMHQVRYFLATVSELNFTKAAEKCNVTQPSLTRAIKQLEDELGGDLFRRERPQAQLTELGQRMHPLLKQCYESALGARSLAAAIQSGEVGALKLALSRTINLELLTPHLTELIRLFNRLEVKLLRGTAPQVVEFLKAGHAELAIAGDIGEEWERLDRWPLFTEEFGLIFNARHRLAAHPMIEVEDVRLGVSAQMNEIGRADSWHASGADRPQEPGAAAQRDRPGSERHQRNGRDQHGPSTVRTSGRVPALRPAWGSRSARSCRSRAPACTPGRCRRRTRRTER